MTAREFIQRIRIATTRNKITPAQMADTLDAILDESQGSCLLDVAITANNVVGGISIGTQYPQGTSVVKILKDALFSYKAPGVSCSGGAQYEWGTTNAVLITYKGTNSSSANVTKIELYKDGTLIDEATKTTAGEYTYLAEGIDAACSFTCKVYDNVKGEVVAATATTNVTFGYKYFGGYAAEGNLPSTSAQVRALTKYTGFTSANKEIVGNVETIAENYHLIVCVPVGFTIAVQNSLGGVIIPIEGETVAVHTGGGAGSMPTHNYKVWYINGTPHFKNLKIVTE